MGHFQTGVIAFCAKRNAMCVVGSRIISLSLVRTNIV